MDGCTVGVAEGFNVVIGIHAALTEEEVGALEGITGVATLVDGVEVVGTNVVGPLDGLVDGLADGVEVEGQAVEGPLDGLRDGLVVEGADVEGMDVGLKDVGRDEVGETDGIRDGTRVGSADGA